MSRIKSQAIKNPKESSSLGVFRYFGARDGIEYMSVCIDSDGFLWFRFFDLLTNLLPFSNAAPAIGRGRSSGSRSIWSAGRADERLSHVAL